MQGRNLPTTKMPKHLIIYGAVVLMSLACAALQPAGTAEPMDMDPAILSKLALQRPKTNDISRGDAMCAVGARTPAGR